MTLEDEVRTFQIGLETTRNGVTVEAPWVQRQANGAIIVRLHIRSPQHQAGELLLNDTDVIALDPDERPLRTQVRRVWGYAALADVTPAHMETARFDVGFRLDIAASRGFCGLAIALLRAFNPAEGPSAIGGPWVFKFRVADDAEVAEAVRNEAARQQAARDEAARQEAARQEAARLAAERRETASNERSRTEAVRGDELTAEGGAVRAEPARPERRPGDRLPRREWEAERARAAQLRAEAEARARAAAGQNEPAAEAPQPEIPAESTVAADQAATNSGDGTPSGESVVSREGRGPRRRGGRFLRPEQAGAERDEDAAIAAGSPSAVSNDVAAAPPEPQEPASDEAAPVARRSGRRGQTRRASPESDATPAAATVEEQAEQPAVRTRRVRVRPAATNDKTTDSE